MAYNFNAVEVFDMAVRIEENGAAFYRKAAELQAKTADKLFLETLAKMEDRHKAIFEDMKAELADRETTQTVFDPDEELSLYLGAMADSHGGEGDPDIADTFTGQETMAEVVAIAVGLEKESILFYVGIKDMVPPKFGRDKIDQIIREEAQHVAQLKGFLQKAKNA
ncbi:MAG: ferritin family protein [Proteobacteria bacterium]|nr:rubrerythrin [Desulfobacula sp.]MBU3953283.1 ferritin family protein [Pseudomonadota bacterium]MBU4132654.1 ferritin family protein [Pseudomonadota bacterium]